MRFYNFQYVELVHIGTGRAAITAMEKSSVAYTDDIGRHLTVDLEECARTYAGLRRLDVHGQPQGADVFPARKRAGEWIADGIVRSHRNPHALAVAFDVFQLRPAAPHCSRNDPTRPGSGRRGIVAAGSFSHQRRVFDSNASCEQ